MITVEQVEKAKGKSPALYLVKDSAGVVLGMLEKYRNTRTDTHPWKAYRGVGRDANFIGAYYPADGGKKAALAAVVQG